MTTQEFADFVRQLLIVALAVAVVSKLFAVIVMSLTFPKRRLDRAIIAHQAAMTWQCAMWESVLWLPGSYAANLRDWLYVWTACAVAVLLTSLWQDYEVTRSRIIQRLP